jgi:hypothetical protein
VRLAILVAFVVFVLWPAVAAAEPAVVADLATGPAYVTTSRSHALEHVVRPAARLGLRVELTPAFELGVAVSGLLVADAHHRVTGTLVHARHALVRRARFSAGVALAIGLGPDADILHDDLRADAGIRPYGFLAIDARWHLGDRYRLGAEVAWEDLSLLRAGLVLGVRLP